MNKVSRTIIASLVGLCSLSAHAIGLDSLKYSVGLSANASTGALAPYMIGSWNEGRQVMKNSVLLDASLSKAMDRDKRFSWGAGVEIIGGYNHSVNYEQFDSESDQWTLSKMRPAAAILHTLYAEAHYRSLYAMIGMKGFESKIVDNRLSSGDLIRSNNARPIPGVTIGFVDFQDIPFTNGWLQIDGQIMYGRFTDDSFRRKQFDHYNNLIATDIYYTYKYCYFRTKPSERFSATFGMQTAGQFGGSTVYYRQGQIYKTEDRGFRVKDIFKMFFPTLGNGNGYYEGNSLGTWSLRARYCLHNDNQIALYWEKPFEDGSGIACRNGTDGLYGIQFSLARKSWFESAVIEYLDLRNHSGPLHWAPGDHPNPDLTSEATGGDNYFNNDTYGSYVNYGMAIGSPMVMAPVYNLNGYPEFIYNRMRGVHAGICGSPCQTISYKLMAGWQKGYAAGRTPLPKAKSDVSALAEVEWDARCLLKGLSVNCRAAFDCGELRGDNFGMALALRYTGRIGGAK